MAFDFLSFSKYFNTDSTNINYDKVKEIRNKSPKRICFKTSHKNSLRSVDFDHPANWALFLPFENSIKEIFESKTNLKLEKTSSGKYWCPMKTETEYKEAKKFKEEYLDLVFLRDTLDCSVALSEHMIDSENRTEIGELEYLSKYNHCKTSTNQLSKIIFNFIKSTQPYKEEKNLICAVPPSINGNSNIPRKICKIISDNYGIQNISEEVHWTTNKTKPLKNMELDKRWEYLEGINLSIGVDITNKNIILVDDLYQSGTTLQFIAMKLKEKGCKKVYGLSIVKSRKDTDNK